MADEYISREAALKALFTPGMCYAPMQLQIVKDLPAADVAEVVFARWEEADWLEYDAQSCETIRYPKAAIVCTNCRCAFKKEALWTRNFCPSCGAKMDGGNDNVSD